MPPLNVDQINTGVSETILDRPVSGPGVAFEVDAVNNAAVRGICGAAGVAGYRGPKPSRYPMRNPAR